MKTSNVNERSMLIESAMRAINGRVFKYGDFDCHIFAADIALTYTDVDYAKPFRGTYSDARGAQAIVDQHGGSVAFVTELVGKDPQPVFHARVGDVMAYRVNDKKIATGICIGARAVFLGLNGGFEFRALDECLCSWKVE